MREFRIKAIFCALIFILARMKCMGQSDSLSNVLKGWRRDSTGCLDLRSFNSALKLIKAYKIDKNDFVYCVSILGQPNEIHIEGDYLECTYYYSTNCDSGAINKKMPWCFIDIDFNRKGKFLDYFELCYE